MIRAGSWVYVVIVRDRHCDDRISVHATPEGAHAKVDTVKRSYDEHNRGDAYDWLDEDTTERKSAFGHGLPWIRYVDAGDDCPKIRIEPRIVE